MSTKETSEEVAAIAARALKEPQSTSDEDVRRLAASCLSQKESDLDDIIATKRDFEVFGIPILSALIAGEPDTANMDWDGLVEEVDSGVEAMVKFRALFPE